MKRVAKFEKVSYNEFKEAILDFYVDNFSDYLDEDEIKKIYDENDSQKLTFSLKHTKC